MTQNNRVNIFNELLLLTESMMFIRGLRFELDALLKYLNINI